MKIWVMNARPDKVPMYKRSPQIEKEGENLVGKKIPPMINVSHPQERPKMNILSLIEVLDEDVCNLIYYRKRVKIDDLHLNQLLEKMHVGSICSDDDEPCSSRFGWCSSCHDI